MVMITQRKNQLSKTYIVMLYEEKKIAISIAYIHTMEKPSTIERTMMRLSHAMTSSQLEIKDQNDGGD